MAVHDDHETILHYDYIHKGGNRNKLIFTLPMLAACFGTEKTEETGSEVTLVYVVDIIEIESDGCNQFLEEDFWLKELNIEFTRNQDDLTGEASLADDPDSEVFDCESSDGSFNCEMLIEDDDFREDEGYSAVMRESFLIEGVWIEELLWRGEYCGHLNVSEMTVMKAIADAWEQDGDFDYPEAPCESVLKFEGIALQ